MILQPGFLAAAGLLAQASAPTSRLSEVERIRVGETVGGVLAPGEGALPGHGPSKGFTFLSESPGPVTLSLESFDFDAFLRVESEGEEKLAENDNGGVETNARVVLDGKGGARYRVLVAAAKEGAGEFALSVAVGDVPRPGGAALLDAGIAHRAKAAERALARGDKAAARDHRMREGSRRSSRSQFAEAKVAYESALALTRELGDRAGEARTLSGLGVAYGSLGEYAKAREQFDQQLALARALGDRAGEAGALGGLGIVYSFLGEYGKARAHQEQALALAHELGDRAGEAGALGNLGLVYYSLGEYGKAREHHERHLALAGALGDRAGEAKALGNLGMVCFSLGEYGNAREYHERQLALARALGDRGGEAAALGNLGNVCASLVDYPKAQEHYEAALSIARDLGYRQAEASGLGNLGIVYRSLGDYGKAREYHERHLALARDLGDRAGEAGALINLGNACNELRDYPKARDHFESGLAIARAAGHRGWEANALGNLATVYDRLGEYGKALEQQERHLALARELGDRAGEAKGLADLGGVYLSLGEHGKAREAATEALAALDGLGILLYQAFPLGTLAVAELAEGHEEEAAEALGRAEALLDRASATPSLERGEAAGLRSRFAGLAEVAQDLTAARTRRAAGDAHALSGVAERGLEAAGRWKGRALLEGIVEHRRGGRSREAIALRTERREALAQREAKLKLVSEAIRKERPSEEIEALRGEATGLLTKVEELAARLREVSPRDGALESPPSVGSESLRQRVVPDRTALLEYAPGAKRLYGYVLTREELRFLDLGDREEIEAEVEEFLSMISAGDQLSEGVPEVVEWGSRLFKRLLAPLLSHAPKVERLLIVPDAGLASLPFEALVVGAKGASPPRDWRDVEFVLDRHEVSYAPSSAVLAEIASLGPREEGGRTLLLADPVYRGEEAEAAGRPAGGALLAARERGRAPGPEMFRRIPNTRVEALAVADLRLGREEERVKARLLELSLPANRSGSASGGLFDLFLGVEATRARLTSGDLRAYDILHLAGHGYVDEEFPQNTGIALAYEEKEPHGYFRILDALDLDLDANLVVLSACRTARGKERAGEGIESLARAFMYAGARAVVASLWNTEDRASAATMKTFYEQVSRKEKPGEALRRAKMAVREGTARGGVGLSPDGARAGGPPAWGHPFFWAPFIYIGLPR